MNKTAECNIVESQKKQLHIRLDSDLYKKLKVKCTYENMSIQDGLSRVIESLVKYPANQPKNQDEDNKLEILELLQKCPILFGVDRYELEYLASFAVIRHFSKGTIIDRQGEFLNSFHIVKDGIVKVFKIAASGQEFIFDLRHRGEIFAEASALTGAPLCAATKALEDAVIVDIGRTAILDLMARNPILASRIANLEFEKIQKLYEGIIDLVASDTRHRLIKLLYGLGRKYGNTLRFTHQEIAEMSGTTTETVTRILTQLQKSGAITLTRGNVTIVNEEKLQSLVTERPYQELNIRYKSIMPIGAGESPPVSSRSKP
jgi:CRP/FNR family cyclic AMP-dependent transcriptional regulator